LIALWLSHKGLKRDREDRATDAVSSHHMMTHLRCI
jgi:hypothetical protein